MEERAHDEGAPPWEGVPHAPNVGAGSFQVHLYETSRIEFH
jgi:hypothetical protein